MHIKPVSMKKRLFTIIPLIIFLSTVYAQPADLYATKGDKGLYVEHTVTPKENFFSIGRMYAVHPKHIAAFNRVDMNKGLAIGQVVRIPLSDTNFVQKGNTGTPVYYKVGEKEGLMKVSGTFNNVTLDNLRKWNGISGNTINAGTRVVVGFLQSKEMPVVTLNPKPAAQEPVATEKVAEKKVDAPKTTTPVPEKKEPVVTEKKPEPKIEPKVEEPKDVTKKPEPKEEPKKPEPVYSSRTSTTSVSESGYFKTHYEQQLKQSPSRKDETVTSGIFKTTSGWVDSKYYLLIDGVQPGTIIKVTNPANSRFIYAKVLGEMSGIKQNDGLTIRISSAGASALQVTEEDKFIVKVNY